MHFQELGSSVYIHIPFCKKICSYCDFCKMYYNEKMVDDYLVALDQEIKKNYQNNEIRTIYIGGGTPSSLGIDELKKLFKIFKIFKMDYLKEFSIECNIEDISEEKLKIFKANGINRLSIGVQSFDKRILKELNRNSETDIVAKILLAKKYFDNINIDLIYGLNSETLTDLQNDLNNFLHLDLPHISIYGLIKEEHTILDVNKYIELDDDSFFEMYQQIDKTLKSAGYNHYEISNYAKEGYESIHNLTYWNNDEYYGFGLGASGFINNIRYDNTRSFNNYLKGEYVLNKKEISLEENMENEMILGLRKQVGVTNKIFYKKYQKYIEDVFDVSKLEKTKTGYRLKESDIYISNSILIDFLLY
ncbi:MAG TPA: radical SAM family heme chaperone HemW [Bacilli bacterium]|nr:radical SAM family heme chaperone HemW [Bacilli bacterium]